MIFSVPDKWQKNTPRKTGESGFVYTLLLKQLPEGQITDPTAPRPPLRLI
jgi:hypothetical protein